jgi:hypothetical protein
VTRFFDWLDGRSTPRFVLILLCLELLVLGCENALMFPLSVPYMRQLTGHNYLDMCAFCSGPQIYQQLTAFGVAGRRLQLLLMPTVDIVIPVTSGLFGATALTALTKSLRARQPAYRWLVLLPVAATLLDFAENAGIVLVTSQYPARFEWLAALTGFTTGLKTLAYGLTLLGVVALTARAALVPERQTPLP